MCWLYAGLTVALIISIALASYIYSLDGQTTYSYLAFATSAFDKHGLISTIQVAQSIISACIYACSHCAER